MRIVTRTARTMGRSGHGLRGIDERTRRILLACGAASSLLYVVANDVVAAARWEGYSRIDQAVSELSSIGAPSRPILVPWLALTYTPLVIAFGVGVWHSARGKRALRAAGAFLVAYGATGPLWLPFPMSRREEIESTATLPLTDLMHGILGAVTILAYLGAIGFGAAALGKRFRLYSFATMAAVGVFGVLTFTSGPQLQPGEPTPWLGVIERTMLGAFLLWVVVLAVALWRQPEETDRGPESLALSEVG
jgi:hypothetical protein